MKRISNFKYLIEQLYETKWDCEGVTFRDILYRLNIVEGKSVRKIAEELQVSPTSVHKWLKELGITQYKSRC